VLAEAAGMTTAARGYWVTAPACGELRATTLATPGEGDVVLRALRTGISPGTERLVGLGRVPPAHDATMAVPGMQGSFALPILYGYSSAGEVATGPHTGRRAFTMHPHTTLAVVAAAACVWLPDDVPAARATLFANLETAWNGVADADVLAGEASLVVGAGAVGLLTAFVLAAVRGAPTPIVDADPERRRFAQHLPWIARALAPDDVGRGAFACVLHASGTGAGLQLAIDALGFEGRVIDLSWYGDQLVTLRLGDSFHRQRQVLRSSQVGTIAPRHRAAGRAARTAAVLELLRDPRLDTLLGEPVPFTALPQFFAKLYRGEATPPCPVVGYE
jgi:2-desacetyl-2-hydroxyethyl bacteriochlorophyllide A dehydrogenase